jgi:cytochrome P450
VHVCIGAHVARLEGVVLVQELLARFPDYEVVDTGLAREVSEFHVGWARMPIRPLP